MNTFQIHFPLVVYRFPLVFEEFLSIFFNIYVFAIFRSWGVILFIFVRDLVWRSCQITGFVFGSVCRRSIRLLCAYLTYVHTSEFAKFAFDAGFGKASSPTATTSSRVSANFALSISIVVKFLTLTFDGWLVWREGSGKLRGTVPNLTYAFWQVYCRFCRFSSNANTFSFVSFRLVTRTLSNPLFWTQSFNFSGDLNMKVWKDVLHLRHSMLLLIYSHK